MNIIFSIFKKELTDVLRDRRTLFFMIAMPVIVMPLIFIGSLKFQEYQNKKSEEKILNIAIVNESDDIQIRDYILNQKGVNLIENIDADSLEKGIKSDSLQGGLYIGKNFLNNISTNQMGAVEIYYKSSDLMSKAKKMINNALDQYKNEVVAERLLRFDIDKNLSKVKPVCILIGPEGDFSETERRLILNHKKVLPVSLGQNILRSETAAIVASTIISFKFNLN